MLHLQVPHLQVPRLQAPHLQVPCLQAPHLQAPRLQALHLQVPRLQAPRHIYRHHAMSTGATPCLQAPCHRRIYRHHIYRHLQASSHWALWLAYVYKALSLITPFTKVGKALPQAFDTTDHWSHMELVLRALGEDCWPERMAPELVD